MIILCFFIHFIFKFINWIVHFSPFLYNIFMFSNIKKCITTNLISLFGYLIFISTLIFLFFILPKYETIEINHREVFSAADIVFFNFLFVIFCVYIFLFILFLCYFIERYLQKSGKLKVLKIFKNFDKTKTIIFWLGYFLIFSPIYYIAILFLYFFIILFINTY